MVGSYRYLFKVDILQIHRIMVERYGGTLTIWDQNKLDAAISAPSSGFGGVRAHTTLYEVAAAYWFHLSQAHPFESANKRTAVEACLTFLKLNGYELHAKHDELYDVAIRVATGECCERDLAAWIETHVRPTL